MEEEHDVNYSPLCQMASSNGKNVEILIYADGDGGWILEVVDEHNNSTVWDKPFASDQLALDEALRTIREDGIDSLIGPPSGSHN